jgi:hypothetical protein
MDEASEDKGEESSTTLGLEYPYSHMAPNPALRAHSERGVVIRFPRHIRRTRTQSG